MNPTNLKITAQDIWASTLLFGAASVVLLGLLAFAFRSPNFQRAGVHLTIASAMLWGVFASLAIYGFWEFYYQFIFPTWARRLAPLDLFFYAAVGLAMWWVACKLPGSAVIWFAILGGIEGILEHLLGIYGLQILDKVPWLQGVSPFPVLVFSFFEYTLYWTLVAWLGLILLKVNQVFFPGWGSV